MKQTKREIRARIAELKANISGNTRLREMADDDREYYYRQALALTSEINRDADELESLEKMLAEPRR